MQARLLCYNLTGERAEFVSALCAEMSIDIRIVDKSELLKPLSELLGFDTQTENKYTGEGFTDEMLVLCFFTQDLLKNFLAAFRQNGVKPVALKAMLTEHNFEWSSIELYNDLKKEHEYFLKNKQDDT
ncbi:MAG: DUF3783 domain-containing protein [Christensenellaceae bacterium]|nr:DUF3783 domain-containing protein [Christensenellaceae bacterium]